MALGALILTETRVLVLGLVVSISLGASFGAQEAGAAAPTDPQANNQQPLQILEVSRALDLLSARGITPADVPVSVLDNGLDLDHPDLQPRLFSLPAATPAPDYGKFGGNPPTVQAGSPGWDMVGNDCNPPVEAPDPNPNHPNGCNDHGTLLAGVLGAAWNNGAGGAGVAPNARFIALRTCWDNDQCYGHIQPAAINWATDRGARVISFSWLATYNQALVDAMARASNTLFVTIPSGNGAASDVDAGPSPFPCNVNLPNVLCVSTSSPSDELDCGGFGATSVDVAVPTQNSVTTSNGGGFVPTACATSYASPTAAGLAALLFGASPQATPAQVRQAIISGARPAAAWQGKSVSGGVANAARAMEGAPRTGPRRPRREPGGLCDRAGGQAPAARKATRGDGLMHRGVRCHARREGACRRRQVLLAAVAHPPGRQRSDPRRHRLPSACAPPNRGRAGPDGDLDGRDELCRRGGGHGTGQIAPEVRTPVISPGG